MPDPSIIIKATYTVHYDKGSNILREVPSTLTANADGNTIMAGIVDDSKYGIRKVLGLL
jgi:hypothetical protein